MIIEKSDTMCLIIYYDDFLVNLVIKKWTNQIQCVSCFTNIFRYVALSDQFKNHELCESLFTVIIYGTIGHWRVNKAHTLYKLFHKYLISFDALCDKWEKYRACLILIIVILYFSLDHWRVNESDTLVQLFHKFISIFHYSTNEIIGHYVLEISLW